MSAGWHFMFFIGMPASWALVVWAYRRMEVTK
jgi:hypothetical protein